MKIPKLKKFAFVIAVVLASNAITPSGVLFPWSELNQISAEELVDPEASETPKDEPPDEETPDGETPKGETPDGEKPNGETPDGETPDGETPTGEPTEEEPPDGELLGGSEEEVGTKALLINYLIDLTEYLPYTSGQVETFQRYLKNKFGEMDEEAIQAAYEQYYMIDEEAALLIDEIMAILAANDEEGQQDESKALLLELLIGDGLEDSALRFMVEGYINGIMTEEEAEELYIKIIDGYLSADEAVWYIAGLTYPTYPTDPADPLLNVPPMFFTAAVIPESLVDQLNKSASPVDDEFREYEVSLSFKVGELTFTEEGTVSSLSCLGWKSKGGPNDANLEDYGVPPGNGNCFGVYLPPGKDFYIKDDTGAYVKIQPNAHWDGSGAVNGNPVHQNNCYVFIPTPTKPANVWFPGLVGTSYDKNVNDRAASIVIYSTLPVDTIYNTIHNVVITDTIPPDFIYQKGSAKIDGSANDISVLENGDGTITIILNGDYVKKASDAAPYSITYQIAAARSAYPTGQRALQLDTASMTYDIETVPSSITSNTCEIDVPPLFKVTLAIDKTAIWQNSDAILTPNIIVLGTDPPSGTTKNGWDIPDKWLDYYIFKNYDKSWADDEGYIQSLDSLDEIPLTGVTGAGVKTYQFTAKMPTKNDPYCTASATVALTVVKGELIIEMVDSGTGIPVTKGLFEALVNYTGIGTTVGGQFSFAADLGKTGHRDARTYAIRQDAMFNAAAYVPYGYQVKEITNNGTSFAIEEIDLSKIAPDYTVTKTITLKVEKIAMPWFRDWAWKKEEDVFDSEVVRK